MATKKNQEIKEIDYRLNPSGDLEQDRGDGEETLLEAIAELMSEENHSYAVSQEEPLYQREVNVPPQTPQLIGSPGDNIRSNGDTITNMNSSLPITTDLSDVRLADDSRTDRGVDGKELYDPINTEIYNPINTEIYNESVCGTGAIATGALPLLFKPSKRKRKKLGRGNGSVFSDDLHRSIIMLYEAMKTC